MRLNQWMTCIAVSSFLANTPINAQKLINNEQLQVPNCLAKHITENYPLLAENSQFQILNVPSKDLDALSLLADKVHCGRFVNVSARLQDTVKKEETAHALLRSQKIKPIVHRSDIYKIKHQEQVNDAIQKVIADNIWQNLTHLTSYHNRSATKNSGVDTAKWLKASFEKLATESGRTDTDAFFVKTGLYKQPSLVTVIGTNLKTPGIVIGAHMDTLDGRMPGAGDDGSGSSSILEMTRVLLSNQNTYKRPIYIVWYAAEERGLVGSQYVVKYFKKNSMPVKAAIQFDMTGYRNDPEDTTMWVYTDYTDRALSNFVAKLIDFYVKVPVDYSSCGYGCSDHASWDEEGIPAAFPCETNFDDHNPYIHTINDTMNHLSLEHMTNFTKLALAFAIETASE